MKRQIYLTLLTYITEEDCKKQNEENVLPSSFEIVFI